MYKSILKELGHSEIFAILSLLIFVAVFTGAVIFALTLKKELIHQMKEIPFDDETFSNIKTEK